MIIFRKVHTTLQIHAAFQVVIVLLFCHVSVFGNHSGAHGQLVFAFLFVNEVVIGGAEHVGFVLNDLVVSTLRQVCGQGRVLAFMGLTVFTLAELDTIILVNPLSPQFLQLIQIYLLHDFL